MKEQDHGKLHYLGLIPPTTNTAPTTTPPPSPLPSPPRSKDLILLPHHPPPIPYYWQQCRIVGLLEEETPQALVDDGEDILSGGTHYNTQGSEAEHGKPGGR